MAAIISMDQALGTIDEALAPKSWLCQMSTSAFHDDQCGKRAAIQASHHGEAAKPVCPDCAMTLTAVDWVFCPLPGATHENGDKCRALLVLGERVAMWENAEVEARRRKDEAQMRRQKAEADVADARVIVRCGYENTSFLRDRELVAARSHRLAVKAFDAWAVASKWHDAAFGSQTVFIRAYGDCR